MARDPDVSDRARYGMLAGYVGVTFLSFPQPIGAGVLDLGSAVGWFGPALLLSGLAGLPPRRALKLGFIAGTAAQTLVLHWLYIVSVVYGHAPPAMGLLGPLGMGAHTGVFVAAFCASCAWFERRGRDSAWGVACLWVTAELLRATGQIGFPWSTIGYSQHANGSLIGIARYTGVYGLSFTVALAGAALARALGDWRRNRRISAGVWGALVGVAALHALGSASLALAPATDSGRGTVRVAALQGNIDQGVKWSPNWVERTIVIYEELARQAAELGAEVIVLPESAIPGAFNLDAELRFRFAQLARQSGSAFVIGSIAVESAPGRRFDRYFDSAFVLQSSGEYTDRYDKSHLVPFGEYVPLQDWIGWLFKAVAAGMAEQRVTAGAEPRSVWLGVQSLASGRLTAGVPICYELLFPDRTRRFVRDGAELLFAITNDAWYGRTGAPHQFLAITALRSAENGVWTARAANTGVSAFIDSHGRVRQHTAIFERGLLVADVPIPEAASAGTFYSRHGDVFAYLCALFAIGMAVFASIQRAANGRAPN